MGRNFHSPVGGDQGGGRIGLYYNPKPGTAAKKQVLQRAAGKLYARDTLRACGMNAIAQAARLNTNALKYYYRDKDTLVADLLVSHVLALGDRVAAAFDSTAEDTPPQRMATLLGAFLEGVHADPDAHATLRLNTVHLSDERRSSVVGHYRPILDTLREALETGVPGLDAQPEMAKLLVRLVVGAMSESVHWFRDGGAMGRHELAQLLAAQLVLSARAIADGTWPVPETLPPPPPPAPAPPPRTAEVAGDALRPGPDGVLWIPTETALNRWGRVKDAALAGMCVVLTERGWPLIQLVPTTALQATMRLVTGRTGTRGRKAKPMP